MGLATQAYVSMRAHKCFITWEGESAHFARKDEDGCWYPWFSQAVGRIIGMENIVYIGEHGHSPKVEIGCQRLWLTQREALSIDR